MSIARTALEFKRLLALADDELCPPWIAVDSYAAFMAQIPNWIDKQAQHQTVRVVFQSNMYDWLKKKLKSCGRVVLCESEAFVDSHNDDVVIQIVDPMHACFEYGMAGMPYPRPNLPGDFQIWIDKPRAVREARACYERELDAYLPPDVANIVIDDYLLGYMAHPFEPVS